MYKELAKKRVFVIFTLEEVFSIDTINLDLENKKRFLKRYKKNKIMLDRLNSQLATIDSRITSIKSPSFSDMPRGGKPIEVSDLISDKMETEDRITRLKSKGRKLRREILLAIDTLDDTRLADVAESFFIDCLSFEEISDTLGFTERYVRKLYITAIIAIKIPPINSSK